MIAIAAGGHYDYACMASYNLKSPYQKAILRFIEITDVTVEFAGGGSDVSYGKISSEELLAPHIAKLEALAAQ